MKRILILFAAFVSFALTSCEKDNYEPPKSMLTGTVTYNGNPVGVRTNGVQLELWQDGYALNQKIPVHVAQDGTFSARLFDGEYKLVRLAGAPWQNMPNDTVVVNVQGNTVQNIGVTPYFIIRDETITRNGNTVTAEFVVEKIVEDAALRDVKLYLNKSVLLDENFKDYAQNIDISGITSGEKVTVSATLPANLASLSTVFARIGVRSDKSPEFYYTQVKKL
ncbi:DUF3823 domain-containing protein [Botryobacter ruber]|uniref:DUF3823 domain-containing protein n=1 Tax=Botryobacter ruber TaxID=2171629 RepID=UPI000E0BFA4C|nr:DUF3823 domain-containing protein [Botryobacter ruber]